MGRALCLPGGERAAPGAADTPVHLHPEKSVGQRESTAEHMQAPP